MRKLMILTCVLLAACTTAREAPDSLYRALGERPGIHRLVTNTLINIAHDDRIVELFRDAKIDRLRDRLVDQICELSGGPCTYTGDSMLKAHGGMHITDAQFNALVEDLVKAMQKQKIAVGAQNRLLALLAPMHGDIVYH